MPTPPRHPSRTAARDRTRAALREHHWLAIAFGAVALLGVAVSVSPAVALLDLTVVAKVNAVSAEPLTTVILALTALGGTQVVLAVAATAVAILLLWRHWQGAIVIALAVVASQVVVQALKLLVSRPRPEEPVRLVETGGFSFPSGHAASSMALYATLVILFARACDGAARVAVVATGALLVIGIGLSRVYLGAHYPTDVAAGWLTGAALALGAFGIARRVPRGPAQRPQAA